MTDFTEIDMTRNDDLQRYNDGKYEILYQSNPYAGDEGETELIFSIQGAEVKYTPGQGNRFSVRVNWKDNRPSVSAYTKRTKK